MRLCPGAVMPPSPPTSVLGFVIDCLLSLFLSGFGMLSIIHIARMGVFLLVSYGSISYS